MSLLSNAMAIPQKGGYNFTDSLRFRQSASAYLSRTNSSAPTNAKIGSLSVWVKRGSLATGNSQYIMETGTGTSNNTHFQLFFKTSNELAAGQYSQTPFTNTSVLFRDTAAWYHIFIAYDSTQATAADRFKLYVNNTLYSSTTTISLNNEWAILQASQLINIGRHTTVARHFDGYMTEFNVVDGQALTPSDFGEYDDTTGVWKPKEYTGTYGNNGWYLPMKATTQASGFNTVLWEGNGTGQSITGVGFKPDFVWLKNRDSGAQSFAIYDVQRGPGYTLRTNSTLGNTFQSGLTSFDADGFTMDSVYNTASNSYVSWCFEAGGTAVSNTDGTITSSVSANTAKGFSIVSFVGNGSAGATVGHGLSSAPKFIMGKNQTDVQSWRGWHTGLTDASYYIDLDSTNAQTSSSGAWNSTAPDSSVVTLGTMNGTNGSSDNMILYCFSEVAGFSKFGSYTGNGSTSGPTVTTGFRPAFVMIKRIDSTSGWVMFDNTRDADGVLSEYLQANTTGAETSASYADISDTGFTINSTFANASGSTFIYMAFADTRDFQWNFDASGNKNNWTPVNINSNASSETTYDIMSDVPTLTDEDTGNFATLNPLAGTKNTISDGNLKYSGSTGGDYHRPATLAASSGKWYFEVKATTLGGDFYAGISEISNNSNYDSVSVGNASNGSQYSMYSSIGGTYCSKVNNGFTTTNLVKAAAGDILQFAFDLDNNKFWFGINNTWADSGNPSTGANSLFTVTAGTYAPALTLSGGGVSTTLEANFGQRPFAYTPPTGYKKLNTYNLPDSAIKDGSKYFNTVLYTGNGGTNAISGFGFQPDLIWWKNRTNAAGHNLMDNVRGLNKYLNSNLTNAEGTGTAISSIDSDGYTINSSGGGTNATGDSYVTWAWLADNTSGSSNTDGTITSTVSANTTAGFSVVTADNLSGTSPIYIGHGLGIAPSVVIGKIRDNTSNWYVQHTSLPTPSSSYLMLNSTAAYAVNSNIWDAVPSTTTFRVGNPQNGWNGGSATARDYVFYCFAEVEGFSKFGSWETLNAGGTPAAGFVYTGFKPRFIIWKAADTSNSYTSFGMQDTERTTYNGDSETLHTLWANASYAEGARGNGSSSGALGANGFQIDFLSNGFNIKGGGNSELASSGTYIYMAWAENPFKNSLAR